MKKAIVLMVVLAALIASTTATAGAWVPGTNYLVQETDVNDLLEKTYDHAFCQGIARFGHRGEFPYEEFVVFDCTTTLDDRYCTGARYKSVKASRRGWFKVRLLRSGSCF